MSLQFKLTVEIPATPREVYNAWLDSNEHALMTNSNAALASHEVGAKHKAHDEYIWGKNLELIPNKKIVQSWRTKQFKETDPDSIIEVQLENKNDQTLLTLLHTNVPDSEYHVETGWVSHYFEPMKKYFQSKHQK